MARTDRLRALQVVEAFGGGALEVVVTLSERLAAQGDSVAIAYGVRPETPGDVRSRVASDVELFALPWTSRNARAQVRAARALRRLVSDWRPDVVHLHSSFAGVVGSLALRGRVPLVYTPHAYSFTVTDHGRARRAVYRGLERLVALRTDLVGAVSDSEAALARDVAGATRVVSVPNGIPELDSPPPPAPSRDGESPLVLAMGRTVPQRRPEECARILASLDGSARVGWIGGGGPEGEEGPGYRALLRAGIEVTGWMDRASAMERLGDATAYLHWTAWDGQPVSVLEAMARDVVVVASDIDANRELLGAEQVCADEEAAIELLRSVVSDPERRERMLQNQRERRAGHGAGRMAGAWRDVYAAVATGAGSGAGSGSTG